MTCLAIGLVFACGTDGACDDRRLWIDDLVFQIRRVTLQNNHCRGGIVFVQGQDLTRSQEQWRGFTNVKLLGIIGLLKEQAEQALASTRSQSSKRTIADMGSPHMIVGRACWNRLEPEGARLCIRKSTTTNIGAAMT